MIWTLLLGLAFGRFGGVGVDGSLTGGFYKLFSLCSWAEACDARK